MPEIKGKTSGFKSSEFWLSLLSIVVGAVLTQLEADGVSGPWVQVAGAVLGAFGIVSYNGSRAKVKTALLASQAVLEGKDVGKP